MRSLGSCGSLEWENRRFLVTILFRHCFKKIFLNHSWLSSRQGPTIFFFSVDCRLQLDIVSRVLYFIMPIKMAAISNGVWHWTLSTYVAVVDASVLVHISTVTAQPARMQCHKVHQACRMYTCRQMISILNLEDLVVKQAHKQSGHVMLHGGSLDSACYRIACLLHSFAVSSCIRIDPFVRISVASRFVFWNVS